MSTPKYGWHEPDERDHEALREAREAAEEEKADRRYDESLLPEDVARGNWWGNE